MSRTIYKYPVQLEDEFTVSMPFAACVLSVGMQREEPFLWASLDTEDVDIERAFVVRGTGHALTGTEGRFIGTFQMRGGSLVFHLFEKKESNDDTPY